MAVSAPPLGPQAGRHLPESAFGTRAFQEEEDAAIWTRAWVCVGFAADVPAPGDVLPFTVGNHGIHVERLADGSLASRFNKAQHGGCRAVPLQCQTGTKTKCSFTACGYSRDRRPIAASDPARDKHLDQYFGLRPERLLPVAVRSWGPLIVTQLDPTQTARFAWPEPAEVIGGRVGSSKHGSTEWIEVGVNWKLLASAFAEPGAVTARGGDHAASGSTSVLFPNLIVVRQAAQTHGIVLQPTGIDRTLCRARTLSAGADPGAATLRNVVHAAAEKAGTRARNIEDPDGLTAMGRWFEGEVQGRIRALRDDRAAGTLYRTDGKGGW